MADHAFVKTFVHVILKEGKHYPWQIQGFGMLRMYLSDQYRLNIWDSRYRVPNVSLMHTHPWDFESLIVAGELTNYRFSFSPDGDEYDRALIKPGPGGGLTTNDGRVTLRCHAKETYWSGGVYAQNANEIHVSAPTDGTVTLNRRQRVGEDLAHVYWPAGKSWVSAEPRNATEEEVAAIVSRALLRFEERQSSSVQSRVLVDEDAPVSQGVQDVSSPSESNQ
jgi:hypothetical protein